MIIAPPHLYSAVPGSVYLWTIPLSKELNSKDQSQKEWFIYTICALLDIRWVGAAFSHSQKLKMDLWRQKSIFHIWSKWILSTKIRNQYSVYNFVCLLFCLLASHCVCRQLFTIAHTHCPAPLEDAHPSAVTNSMISLQTYWKRYVVTWRWFHLCNLSQEKCCPWEQAFMERKPDWSSVQEVSG